MSVAKIAAAAKEAGVEGDEIVAFALGFSAGANKPVLRENPDYSIKPMDGPEPNTLYGHPISGNCLGAFCYVVDNNLGITLSMMDILAGKQMADWYLKLNPMHTVPTMCNDKGQGVWESGVVLRTLAGYAGEEISPKVAMAMDFRQTVMYEHCSKIYLPYLFNNNGADPVMSGWEEGVKGLKEKVEPVLKDYFLADGKFIGGGDTPSVADYHIVPVLTMLPPYLAVADERITTYVADFKAASSSFTGAVGATQSGYVETVVKAKPVSA